MTTLGRHPDALAVKLTLGDGAHLVASTVNGWAGPVTLHYGPKTGDPVISDVGTVDGDEVSWTLTEAEVTARAEHDWARLEDNGVTLAAGPVMTWLGGLGSTTTQTIASLTAGPPGPTAVSTDADNVAGLGSDGLIYVSPADAGGFSDAAVAAFVADEDSDTYASITALQPDLSGYVETTDARLSDARTPTTHATSHASGGSDPVTPASIGAATPAQVSSGDTATLAAAQLHAQGLVDALTAASPATLDTLAEIAAALGEDSNFAATMTAALAARVRHDAAQSLTVSEQAQARSNIGAAPALGPDDNYVTDAEKAALHSHANKAALDLVSGENTGDQDLSGYALSASLATVATSGEAADLDATGATVGHVLTADGAGGAAWEAPSGGGSDPWTYAVLSSDWTCPDTNTYTNIPDLSIPSGLAAGVYEVRVQVVSKGSNAHHWSIGKPSGGNVYTMARAGRSAGETRFANWTAAGGNGTIEVDSHPNSTWGAIAFECTSTLIVASATTTALTVMLRSTSGVTHTAMSGSFITWRKIA